MPTLYNLRITVTHVLEVEDWNPSDYLSDFDEKTDEAIIEYVEEDSVAVDSAIESGKMSIKVEIIHKEEVEEEDQGPSVLGGQE